MAMLKRLGVGVIVGTILVTGGLYWISTWKNELWLYNGQANLAQAKIGEQSVSVDAGVAKKVDIPKSSALRVEVSGSTPWTVDLDTETGMNLTTFLIDASADAGYVLVDLSSLYGNDEREIADIVKGITLVSFSTAGRKVHRFETIAVEAGPGEDLPDSTLVVGDGKTRVQKLFRVRPDSAMSLEQAQAFVERVRKAVMEREPLTALEHLSAT
jgi:hypothetical protein